MRDGWVETSLGDVAQLTAGPAFKSETFHHAEDGYKLLRGMNIGPAGTRWDETYFWPADELTGFEKYKLSKSDICLTMDATFTSDGRIRAALLSSDDLPALLNQRVMRIRSSNGADQRFLWLVIGSSITSTHLRGSQTGAFAPHVSGKDIASIRFPLPPIEEQRRIVDVIESVDTYIAALEKRAETARTARSALLHDLLSNPGPDWLQMHLPDVVEVLDRLRKPISAAEREKRRGEVPYFGATGQAGWIDEAIFDEELVLLGEDAIDFLNPHARKSYRVSGPAWVNNHAHVLRPRPEVVLPGFLNESLNLVDYSQHTSFGTRSKLTQAQMNQITLAIPPLEAQTTVELLVAEVDTAIDRQLQSLENAKRLRAALLSDLLSGNHEIPTSYDELLGAA